MSRNICVASRSVARRRRVGDLLGVRLGRRAVDVSDEVRQWVGEDVTAIIETHGAERFAGLCRQVVAELARVSDLVVSLDVDVADDPSNVAALALTSVVIDVGGPGTPATSTHLTVSPDRDASRVVDDIVSWTMAVGDVLTPSEHEQVMT